MGGIMRAALFLLALSAPSAFSANLAGQLTGDEIGQVVNQLGGPGSTRLLRSAEAYPKFWPGLKVGLQFDMLFAGALEKLGNGTGNVPGFIPQPRFYISKALFLGLEAIFTFFPSSVMSTLGSTGGILKFNFYTEEERDIAVAFFAGYTSIAGLNGTYSGSSFEGGVYASRDFVRLRPYLGMAAIYAKGEVPLSHAATAENSASALMLHSFGGCEFNLPIDVTVQLDLYNISPGAALFFGKKF